MICKRTVWTETNKDSKTIFNEVYLFFEKTRTEFRKSDNAHMYQHKTSHIHQHTCWSKLRKYLSFFLIAIKQIFEKNCCLIINWQKLKTVLCRSTQNFLYSNEGGTYLAHMSIVRPKTRQNKTFSTSHIRDINWIIIIYTSFENSSWAEYE